MKKKICILTATRAEYGLLKPIIKKLNLTMEFDVRIVVTGSHLSSEFGLTYREIEKDGFDIDKKIDILLSSDSPSAISKTMALAIIGFADYFDQLNPDMLILLGDRYETLSVAISAMNLLIPIAHIHGGETTEGAIDESIRHCITKLSYLHFTSTNVYRNRVIQMGENPSRVYSVGAVGVENVLNEKLLTKSELEKSINFNLDRPYGVLTFHPVTLENNSSELQIRILLEACIKYKNMKFIFTKSNADSDSRIINSIIDEYVNANENLIAFNSMGLIRYLSAMKYSSMVIGNSSSGIIEAPSFGVPTINIGDRQKGRIQASSVINCKPILGEITKAIEIALSPEFKNISINTINPYGKGNTSEEIVRVIKSVLLEDKIDIKKKFHDC